MSDLLQAASETLGVPTELVRRSAAARAQVNGTTVDETLAAWSGGAPAPAPSGPAEAKTVDEAAAPTEETEPQPAPAAAAVAVEPAPVVVEPAPEPLVEAPSEVELEPVPMRIRLRTAVRIGAWTGAALGVVGFLAATAFWAPNTVVLPDTGPLVQVGATGLIVGMALVSVAFGAVVAGISRAATAWTNPAMELTTSRSVTAWTGAAVGLVLGVIAGAVLHGLGTPVEASDPPLVQLPVLPTLFIMMIGGAVLGAITAMVPQLLGVPVAVEEGDEVGMVRDRLRHAVSVPVAGLALLVVLVLPFAYALIQSNHLAPNGGAVVAIIAAAGILGFSALAGTKPEMRISFGDLVWAIVGIGVVLVIIISVLFHAGGDHEEAPAATEEAAVTFVLTPRRSPLQ